VSKTGQRLLTSAGLVVAGLIVGIAITQIGSAVAVTPQQARPVANTDAPALDEAIPQGAFVRVAEQTQQALVFIQTELTVSGNTTFGDVPEMFRRFFDSENEDEAEEAPDRREVSQGSGFLISEAGYIVTNAHVVSQTDVNAVEVKTADEVTVFLNNQDEYEATIVGVDIGTDLAVLKIDTGYDLPYIPLGDSDQSRVGEWVMALGAPFGLTNTVSAGIISAKGRALLGGNGGNGRNGSAYQDFIQTDASINPGNSGGPLVNLRGEVIGINTMIISNGFRGQFSGVGFAIPINLVSGVVDQLIEHGRTIRGWLGISMSPLDPRLAEAYGMDRRQMRGAVEIRTVNPNEPADDAGVRVGDIVMGTNGVDLEDNQDFLQRIAMTPPDESIRLQILRVTPDDTAVGLVHDDTSIEVMLGERPPEIEVLADQNQLTGFIGPARGPAVERELTEVEQRFGMKLAELDRNLASELEYRIDQGGIVITNYIDADGLAYQLRLGEGTIIQRVNLRPVNSVQDFAEIVGHFEPGEAAVFELRFPSGGSLRLAVEIPE